MKRILIFHVIFSLTVLTFCSKDKKTSERDIYFQDSTVVAVVNGEKITYNTVDDAARQMLSQSRMMNEISYKDSLVQQRSLEWLIAHSLLKQEIVNQTIEVQDKEVDAAIDQIKRNFPSEQVFEEALQRDNTTITQVRENMVINLKIQKLLEQATTPENLEVSTEEARKYYDENPSQFQRNEEIKARHILFLVKKDATEADEENARQKAEMVLSRAKQGEDFTQLAKTYSEDPASKSKGGDLGFFARGDMVRSFDDVAFSLQKGEMSDVIRTELGFHIIKVEDMKTAKPIPFEQMEKNIQGYLKQVKTDEAIQKYIDKLKEKAKIFIRNHE